MARFLLGHPVEAEQMFRRAVDIASADGAGASVSSMLTLNLARTVIENGRTAEGLEVAERAVDDARKAGGPVGGGAIAAGAERGQSRVGPSLPIGREPGRGTSRLGRCYLALGEAHRAEGRSAEARVALAEAIAHLEPSLGASHVLTVLSFHIRASRIRTSAPWGDREHLGFEVSP